MTELFAIVESQLTLLVAFGEELDPLNSLNMLVVIGQRVTQAQQARFIHILTPMVIVLHHLCNCRLFVLYHFVNHRRTMMDHFLPRCWEIA